MKQLQMKEKNIAHHFQWVLRFLLSMAQLVDQYQHRTVLNQKQVVKSQIWLVLHSL